ncbi:MAG: hypothetical protein FJW39_35130 [Acidobacteria bacterium]|nr:hypothetical protein [Acidobacteriota bacterium]
MRRLAYLLPVCLTAAEDFEFFEKKVRPVLASRCYACHSTKAKPVQGDFYADSKDGVRRGGKSGVPAVIPGNPAVRPHRLAGVARNAAPIAPAEFLLEEVFMISARIRPCSRR